MPVIPAGRAVRSHPSLLSDVIFNLVGSSDPSIGNLSFYMMEGVPPKVEAVPGWKRTSPAVAARKLLAPAAGLKESNPPGRYTSMTASR
jgi:hypothetical protein